VTAARWGAVSLAAAAAVVVVGSARGRAQQNRPVFQSTTDLVTVDVSVRSSGTPVAGLKPEDFVVLDNGVPQHVDSLDTEAVPVEVTLIVDTNHEVYDSNENVNRQARSIAARLRPDDELRVLRLDTYVTEVLPMRRAASQPPLEPLPVGHLASAYDAIAAALMWRVPLNRRHLVIAITNGLDTASTLDMAALRDIAGRSGATLHIAQVDTAEDPPVAAGGKVSKAPWRTRRERERQFACGASGRCWPQVWFWQPHYEPPQSDSWDSRFGPLSEVAALTGGQVHQPGLFRRNAADVFASVFKDFRQNYLLRYTPKGVAREGWHTLTVRIPTYPGYTIHARSGYAIEGGAPAPAATRAPAAPPSSPAQPAGPAPANGPATLADFEAAYGRSDYRAANAIYQRLGDPEQIISDFRAGGNPWPAAPDREAVLALELADGGLFSHSEAARAAGLKLLDSYRKLVRRPFAPDRFEHDWYAAGIDLVEGLGRPDVARSFVEHALARFPDDPRFLLAGAILGDQAKPLGALTDLSASDRKAVQSLLDRYETLAAYTAVAGEARVRQAWLLHRLDRNAEALSELDRIDERAADAYVRYLCDLFRGEVLDALGRPDDALAAYRAALSVLPDAQSARVALMNAFFRRGDRRNAQVLADGIQTAAENDGDPWWWYWEGDYRFFAGAIARLRDELR
jgi:tetratricopeptide (TPR) repeat protein